MKKETGKTMVRSQSNVCWISFDVIFTSQKLLDNLKERKMYSKRLRNSRETPNANPIIKLRCNRSLPWLHYAETRDSVIDVTITSERSSLSRPANPRKNSWDHNFNFVIKAFWALHSRRKVFSRLNQSSSWENWEYLIKVKT